MTTLHTRVVEWATRARLTRFGVAVSAALVVALAFFVLSSDGTSGYGGVRFGGDWATFWSAGRLIREDPRLLLDLGAQSAAMASYMDGGFFPFANPPIFAVIFVPLSLLPFTASYVLWMAVLVLAAAYGTRAAMDVLAVPERWQVVGILGALTFAPTFDSVIAAQNATLRLWFMGLGFRQLQRGQPWIAGAILAGTWFKPQFAVPLIALLAAVGRWRTATAAALGGAFLWIVSVPLFGAEWLQTWWQDVVTFTDAQNAVAHLERTISPVHWTRIGIGGTAGLVVALAVGVGIGLGAVWVGRRFSDVEILLPLSCAALLLTAPHAFAYEAATLVPVLGGYLALRLRQGLPAAILGWSLAPFWLLVYVPPLRVAGVLLVVCLWLWAVQQQTDRNHEDAGIMREAHRQPDR
ncbi:glycosyltransferase family 87 protein [Salsipaludibacter albus]|uniref:glycosyltransferase family 87 protein n=1 Tax=Salsipaludibacter albus TaxID=2849650 RepID=UPI001EE493A4|nr:glycosyltransferase family 87 protein [Salsipaludibacter albus]MBY5162905.1 DUF2029 domain-containing protein [Salsipaludibacter albus]